MYPVVAIDIGGTKTIVGIIDRYGEILYTKKFMTLDNSRKYISAETHLKRCADEVKRGLERLGLNQDQIEGIGISLPGMVDSVQGILIKASFLGWENISVINIISQFFNCENIKIQNDVNACAVGELLFAKGIKYNDFAWVTVSTGIGASLVLNKELYTGKGGIAGELGHVKVEWDQGRQCSYGQFGCLEAHASGTAMGSEAQKRIESGDYPDLTKYFHQTEKTVSAYELALAASSGLADAHDIYKQAGIYLGRAFSYLINILNPGAIINGGGVAEAFDLFEPGIELALKNSVIGKSNNEVVITTTGLGYQAALMGAAALVLHDKGML